MFNKLKNRKGFTLMEMLIVVAIIAILVAIAIPTFNNAMAKSRAATDLANIRSGYAAAIVAAMTDTIPEGGQDYYLQSDGSVAVADTNAYVCKGAATKVPAGSTVGGKFAVGTDVTWSKDNKVQYHVTAGSGESEGVPTVETITCN